MSDAIAAATALDGLRVAFLYALLGLSTRSLLATSAFVLGCRNASRDIVLILVVGGMVLAGCAVAARLLASSDAMGATLGLGLWVVLPSVLTLAVASWTASKPGRAWQALLADAALLWGIGYNAERDALLALISAVVLIAFAGVVLAGQPMPSAAVCVALIATILLTINQNAVEMTYWLVFQGGMVGIFGHAIGEPGAAVATFAGVPVLLIWQYRNKSGAFQAIAS